MKYKYEYYKKDEVEYFRITTAKNGGLSNMAGGYSLVFKKFKITHVENLYQACKFPDYPELQKIILSQVSPMIAKEISRKNKECIRKDWEEHKVEIMMWCIRMKLLKNWGKFSNNLKDTANKDIVEYSNKDIFWGARDSGVFLEGYNILGKLLKKLRQEIEKLPLEKDFIVDPPKIENFKLFGYTIPKFILTIEEKKKSLKNNIISENLHIKF